MQRDDDITIPEIFRFDNTFDLIYLFLEFWAFIQLNCRAGVFRFQSRSIVELGQLRSREAEDHLGSTFLLFGLFCHTGPNLVVVDVEWLFGIPAIWEHRYAGTGNLSRIPIERKKLPKESSSYFNIERG